MALRRPNRFSSFVATGLIAITLVLVTGCSSGPKSVGEFALTDASGKAFSRDRLAGQWTFLVFGYTSCPDVCPITLSELAKVYQLLKTRPDSPKNVQVVFISVDPARDNPDALQSFTRFFDPDIIAATGPIPELNRLSDSLGAFHRRLTEQGEEYRVEHSADVWLINPGLHLQTRFAIPLKVDRVVTDFIDEVSKGAST